MTATQVLDAYNEKLSRIIASCVDAVDVRNRAETIFNLNAMLQHLAYLITIGDVSRAQVYADYITKNY